VGLHENLDHCTRGDSTWQMALAIEVAFSLGKIAARGEAEPGLLARLSALEDAWRRGADTGGGAQKKKDADRWRLPAKPFWWEKRGSFVARGQDGASQRWVAEKIKIKFVDPLGESIKKRPKIERIVDTISKWDEEARAGMVMARNKERR
jgi:hypothetical protein